MKKVLNALRFVWKNNRVWLLVSSITLVIIFTATLVATQNVFLANTISTVMGGERRVLISGDPTKYEYFKPNTDDFIEYTPENLDYKNKSIFAFNNSSKQAKTDTYNEANRLNERIVEEGIVLLKNDNALPFTTSASAKKKVSVFGKNSVNLVYGGSGSGGGKTDGAKTIYDSLSAADFDVNPTLKSFYQNNGQSGSGRQRNPSMGDRVVGIATGETPQSSYTQTVKNSYNTGYKDAAIVVFSRIGGEGFDLPHSMRKANGTALDGANADDHYLQLDNNERELLSEIATVGFEKIIVVINCSTSMQLDFLDNPAYKIDGALWLGSPGYTGVMALGRVMNGSVNPSGRLVDTYAKDFRKDPTYVNFAFNGVAGDSKTPAGNEYRDNSGKKFNEYYVEYAEGIYVGYRYYETRSRMIDGTDGGDWYDKNVVFPFGYGLSYTDFTWEIVNADKDGKNPTTANSSELTKDGSITINVKVTNKNGKPGKDVVQLYYSAPFLGNSSGRRVEKAHVVLGDFAKTKKLEQGQTDIVTLKLNVSDMASYDFNGKSAISSTVNTYKLDQGNYTLYVGDNAHTAWTSDSDRASLSARRRTFSVPAGGFVYDKTEDGVTIENRFADENTYMAENVKTLSRYDFDDDDEGSNIIDAIKAPVDGRKVNSNFISSLQYMPNGKDKDSDNKWYVKGEVPEYGKSKQADDPMLWDMISLDANGKAVVADYNDPRWDNMVKRMTIDEMATLIGTGNFNSARVDHLGKPKTTDPDGPAGFTNFMGDPTVYDTCYYASECVIGATWNKNLAHDMGVMVGLEGIWGNQKGDGRPFSGWYAPAMNIHRTPFSGRNFEYYSEDPYISGIMGAHVIQGAKKKGVYTYIKHFALNDQETNRGGVSTWATEQTMREIYLKPFEIAVKVGGSTGVMSSFNRIGRVWAGGDYRLLTEILRDEWGFKGMVISDYNTYSHMPADQMIRAGGDLNLIQNKPPSSAQSALTATHVTAMQKASKNILYTVAGSNAMNGMGPDVEWGYRMPMWIWYLIFANLVLLAGFAVWGVFAIRSKLKKSKVAG